MGANGQTRELEAPNPSQNEDLQVELDIIQGNTESAVPTYLPLGDEAVKAAQAMTNANQQQQDQEGATVVGLSRHLLSKEQQLLYKHIIQGAMMRVGEHNTKQGNQFRENALRSLREDPGLQQLLPFFIEFVANEASCSSKR
ncbi:uncharacterized protein MONBRDRAFT_7580 [Monosiga brevicollis MX1]|uniref:TAF6 C-terminal HEAT repeat domain-containing protein n=1 Tax=Monosiga brevicollis TaxID=81824 RepID=A9UXP5_MONBE|nr:uncharacterized protein MONBRDRAFT_7580 [Monosiga brevicollis MX1]EDQ89879.1 predicted protein [Monosiga brevicollis MX1]|eukprot:XP_001745301.1 hypothetical protein [Monosiga brevicollis MX1]